MDKAHLTVQTESQQHEEEQEGPEGGQRQHGHGLRVDNKGQARAWAKGTRGQQPGACGRPHTHTQTHMVAYIHLGKPQDVHSLHTSDTFWTPRTHASISSALSKQKLIK